MNKQQILRRMSLWSPLVDVIETKYKGPPPHVWSGVGLVLCSFFNTIQVSIMSDTMVFDTIGYTCSKIFVFQYHLGLYTMQEPSHLCKITVSTNMI